MYNKKHRATPSQNESSMPSKYPQKERNIYMKSISVERRIIHMNELIERKSAEHNDLIMSVAKMDRVPLKMFSLAVSCIDTENPPKDNTVYLSKKELFAFFQVEDTNKHHRFKQAIEKMQKQAFFQISEKSGKGFEYVSIVPIPYVKWNDYNDEVTIRFDVAIMPYLIDLKRDFTQINILELINLNSKYSVILYKWLSMNYNQYEHYLYKGNRTKKQLESLRNPEISIEELRRITDTKTDYKRFYDFERKVILQAIEEINEYTKLNITYKKIKKGRLIDSVKFQIDKQQTIANEPYKENQQDPVFLESQEQKEQQKQQLVSQALESRYTTILGEQFVIGFKDMQDTNLMANLQKTVYPLYDELKERRGLNGVKDHIRYVVSHQIGYSRNNIVKYLKTAVESYLVTVKTQDKNSD